ncbi:MAG: glycosyltransferase family 2 protein [Rivularia sp. (in: Bacteria)]|nr:glycosyltransferase family 2 protein [Rivularia sp. MS3]
MEHSSNSLVSVIIPAYNAEAFIGKTLESVIAQTYRNLEILVVDDGSTDNTARIVREYMQKDSRIHLFSQTNAGVAAARNLGISKSQGEFVAPIDADDIWYPQNIEKQVQAMQRGGSCVGLVYSWSVDIDELDRPTGGFKAARITGNVFKTFVAYNFIGNASATMIRLSCLDRIGYYDARLRLQNAQGCEDWDFYLRIAEQYEFQVVPEFLVGYRKVSNSMSCDYRSMAKSHALVMASVRQRHPYLPQYLFKLSGSNLYMYFAHQSDRYQHHDITRFWLKEALNAEPFTTFIRFGFYRLLLNSTWSSMTQSLTVQLSVSSTENNINIQPSQGFQNALTSFKISQFKIGIMIAVGNIFNYLVNFLIKGLQHFRPNSQTSLSMEEKR